MVQLLLLPNIQKQLSEFVLFSLDLAHKSSEGCMGGLIIPTPSFPTSQTITDDSAGVTPHVPTLAPL